MSSRLSNNQSLTLDEKCEKRSCQLDYLHFNRLAMPRLLDEPYKPLKHIDVLGKHLQACGQQKIMRLLANLPPGTGKSASIAKTFPAWVWTFWPSAKFLYFSYDKGRAEKDSVESRTLIKTEWYRRLFGVTAKFGDDQKSFFRNTAGGYRMTSFPGGPATGEHPNFIIIDDPVSADEVKKVAIRKFIADWYFGTISTRGMGKDACHIVTQQRLHVEDLSGHILKEVGEDGIESSEWYWVLFPMRYDPEWKMLDRGYGGDWRTEEGELLCPTLLNAKQVDRAERALRRVHGMGGVNAQMGQKPIKTEGQMCKTEYITELTIDQVPADFDEIVRFWDTAATSKEENPDACWTTGVAMAVKRIKDSEGVVVKEAFYVLDVRREQLGVDDVEALIESTLIKDEKRWGVERLTTCFEQTPGPDGKAMAELRVKRLRGHRVLPIPTGGRSKDTRFEPFCTAVKFREVSVVTAPWTSDYLDELAKTGPGAALRDSGDATGGAYTFLVGQKYRRNIPTGTDSGDGDTPKIPPAGSAGMCKTEGCKRPAHDGEYCCGGCRKQKGARDCHEPECNGRYTDWWNKLH